MEIIAEQIKKKRGRKPGQKNGPKVKKIRFSQGLPPDRPKKYDITFSDGAVWHYNWDKNPLNGIISTDNNEVIDGNEIVINDEDLPLTKRKWINPVNGKEVGYTRAIQLGLFTPEKGDGKRGRPKKK